MTPRETKRQLEVARLIQEVGRKLHVFDYQGQHYLPPYIDKVMRECECAFANDAYDLAERKAKVVAFMVSRAGSRFEENPKRYIEERELRPWQ